MGEKKLSSRKTILAEATHSVVPFTFLDYSKYLEALFQHIKKQVGYTYSDFSYDLGFGATTYVHQIIRRYRSLTNKNAEKIAARLDLTGAEKKYFLNLVKYAHAKSASNRDAAWKEILKIKANEIAAEPDHDVLEYFSQWYHPVVREYLNLPEATADPAIIAKKMVPSLRPEQVRESLELLERLKLVELDLKSGRLRQTSERVSTGHRVKSHAIVNYHLQMINLARDSLANIPGKERDISAMTLSVSPEVCERIKAMIHAFQLQILEEAEKSVAPDKVIQINIQLFPVTKSRKQG